MFGMPPQQAPRPEWANMYFYQKVQHIVDTGSEAVFGKMKYWVPAIGVTMVASLFLFAAEDAIPQGTMLVAAVGLPHPSASVFGQKMPDGMPPGPEGDDDEDDE